MNFGIERSRFGIPHLVFIWVFGLAGLGLVVWIVGTQFPALRGIGAERQFLAGVYLLLLMLCVFLRYRPKRSMAVSSEDALTLAVVLTFPPELAIAVMGAAAVLNTISHFAGRALRHLDFIPWQVYLGEIFFQAGLTTFVTLTGGTVYRLLSSDRNFEGLEVQHFVGIPATYLSIVLIRWSILFIHEWTRGISVWEYFRETRELQSLFVFLTEVSNVFLGVAMAVVHKDLAVFLILSGVLVSIVALLSSQAKAASELESTIVELKILTGVGRALSNASQTRKELLKTLYTQGKELFGADSLAIYLFPENPDSRNRGALELAGAEFCVRNRPHRRRQDYGGSGKWSISGSFAVGDLSGKQPSDDSTDIPEEKGVGLAEWCLNKGRSLRLGNIETDAASYGYGWLTVQMPYRSWLGVPLEVAGRPLGVISVAGEAQSAFTEQHQELLRALGQQVVSGLENARLFELATIDGLTGLINSRHLRQRLAEEFEKAKKTQKPLGLFMIDIDYFKKINDTHGHEVGNEVLKHLAKLVRGRLRDSDIAARYGGEEFTVLLPNTPPGPAFDVAERLRVAVAQTPVATQAGIIQITVSIGVATYPVVDVPDQDALVSAADKALYKSKQNGRNRVTNAADEG